jgi:hypothetical protein
MRLVFLVAPFRDRYVMSVFTVLNFCITDFAIRPSSHVACRPASYRSRFAIGIFFVSMWCLSEIPFGYGADAASRQHPAAPAFAPRGSDVVFSTRSERPDSLSAIEAFQATRVEWVYSADRNFIRNVQERAETFGGTLNANVKTTNDVGVAVDFDGKPIVAPWMTSWGAKWVTTTHPETRSALFAWGKRYLDAGANVLHVDDPALQAGTVEWGGDFNEGTLSGFRTYLKNSIAVEQRKALGIEDIDTFNYREYLKTRFGIRSKEQYVIRLKTLPSTEIWRRYLQDSVRAYFHEFRGVMNSYAGRPVALSMNALLTSMDSPHLFLAGIPDYVIVETHVDSVPRALLRAATAKALGVGFVPSLIPQNVPDTRTAIATYYALGANPLVPWDVFMGADSKGAKPRYFGKVEDYGDLFAFVRRYPHLFDDVVAAKPIGVIVSLGDYRHGEVLSLVESLASRAIPFSLIPVGSRDGISFPLTREALKKHAAFVVIGGNNKLAYEVESRVSKGTRIVTSSEELSYFAPAKLAVALQDTFVFARERVEEGKRSIIIHIIEDARRRRDRGSQSDAGKLELFVAGGVLEGKQPARVILHTLRKDAAPSAWKKAGSDIAVSVEGCREWCVVKMDL